MKMRNFVGKLIQFFKKEVEVVEEYKFLHITDEALAYYRKNVGGNQDITEDQARRKLTRNMELAFPYKMSINKHTGCPRSFYSYGCLRFMVEDGVVIWIKNWQKPHRVWSLDQDKYIELSKKYGIEEYKTFE